MGIIFQIFPGSLNSQSKAVSQCSQKAFRKDASPLLMGKWQERIPGCLPCHPIHVVSYEKVSYPMFPPTFTSWSMTDDSWRKIRTLGSWLPIAHQVPLRRLGKSTLFLNCSSPIPRYWLDEQANWVQAARLGPIWPLGCTFGPKQRSPWKFISKTAPLPTAHFLLTPVTLSPSLSNLWIPASCLPSLLSWQDFARITGSQCWTFTLHSATMY